MSANERLKCLLHTIQIDISGQAQGSRNIVCGTDIAELLLHIDPTLRTSYWIIIMQLRLTDRGFIHCFRFSYFPRQLTNRCNRIYLSN
ncbi:hypothetical protein D3C73_584310 [compost metagenome]